MTTPSLGQIAAAARAAVRNECAPDSCIETTRVLIAVAAYWAIRLKPVPVKVQVFNAAAWAAVEDRLPLSRWPEGAYSLGIDGTTSRRAKWNGHLVAVGPGDVIDASADQFDRPRQGIDMNSPLVLYRPPGWPANGRAAGWTAPDTGLRVLYDPGVTDQTWRHSEAWRGHRAVYRAVIADAIDHLRGGDPAP
jgi:hypothetical protein